MQRPGKRTGSQKSSSNSHVGRANHTKRPSRYLKDGLNTRWIAFSIACGLFIWFINHYGIMNLVAKGLRAAKAVGVGRGGSMQQQGSLNIHETFSCRSEAEDFSILMNELHNAGLDVGNIELGYSSKGHRGLFVSAVSLGG